MQHVLCEGIDADGKVAPLLASGGDTVLRLAIAASTSGDNVLLAGVAGKKIRVTSLSIVAGAAGNVYFTTDPAGAPIWGGSTNKINLATNQQYTLPFNEAGWFETVAGDDLVMNASSTGPFSGGFTYVLR